MRTAVKGQPLRQPTNSKATVVTTSSRGQSKRRCVSHVDDGKHKATVVTTSSRRQSKRRCVSPVDDGKHKTTVVTTSSRGQSKRRCVSPVDDSKYSKKLCVVATPVPPCASTNTDDVVIVHSVNQRRQYFCPVNVSWQKTSCTILGLRYHNSNNMKVSDGGVHQPLTEPYLRRVRRIIGDGNCLFRSFSFIVTGSEVHHMEIRQSILCHMIGIADLLLGHHINGYQDIYEYIQETRMDQFSSWGTDVEMLTFSHLLQTHTV